MNEINILKRKIGFISQSDVVNHQATKSEGYCEVKLDAKRKATNTSNEDPSIFDDAYDDSERRISGLSYYSALQMLSSSASTNAFIGNINIGNDDHKHRFSSIFVSDVSWVPDKGDSRRTMTESLDLNTNQDRITLTKKASKVFAQELAGNLASTRRPFPANVTINSLEVHSSNVFMPKTDIRDVPSKSCDMNLEADITKSNIDSLTEQEKVQLVISNASLCDTRFSRNIQPVMLSSSSKMNDVTFIEDDEITDVEILSGRVGKSNHHLG